MYVSNNPFELKEDNPSQRNCQSQFSHPVIEFDSRKDLHPTKLKQRYWLLIRLSFREVVSLKLPSLCAFDSVVISLS